MRADAAIGEGEQHGVLVRHAGRPEQPAGLLFELEPVGVPSQAVGADAPRPPAGRRHVGVGHQKPPVAPVLDPLHPRVLEAQRPAGARLGEDVAVLVVVPVGGGEHDDVGDVVEKTRPCAVTGAVAVPHGPDEQVVGTGVMQDTGVEQRPVAEHRSGLDDGPVAQAPDRAPWNPDHRAVVHGASCSDRWGGNTRVILSLSYCNYSGLSCVR